MLNIIETINEYKLLNMYGRLVDLKRFLFESNKKYKKRLTEYYIQNMKDFECRTLKKLKEKIEEAGFRPLNFDIKKDFEKDKLVLNIELF